MLCKSSFESFNQFMANYPYYNTIDFKPFVQENHISIYSTTCSLGQLDEKINHLKT
jgi:hypothetical protein